MIVNRSIDIYWEFTAPTTVLTDQVRQEKKETDKKYIGRLTFVSYHLLRLHAFLFLGLLKSNNVNVYKCVELLEFKVTECLFTFLSSIR